MNQQGFTAGLGTHGTIPPIVEKSSISKPGEFRESIADAFLEIVSAGHLSKYCPYQI
jgi:hypothetical protein